MTLGNTKCLQTLVKQTNVKHGNLQVDFFTVCEIVAALNFPTASFHDHILV